MPKSVLGFKLVSLTIFNGPIIPYTQFNKSGLSPPLKYFIQNALIISGANFNEGDEV